jgi:hypothetical protein
MIASLAITSCSKQAKETNEEISQAVKNQRFDPPGAEQL